MEFEDLIEMAKIEVEQNYEGHIIGKKRSDRKWLQHMIKPYDNESYGIILFVLEGSPAKGYVIVNNLTKNVLAFDSADELIEKFMWGFQA